MSNDHPSQILNSFPSYRYSLLRWLRRICFDARFGYVVFDGTEKQLWRAAVKRTPWMFRLFGKSESVSDLDAILGTFPQWVHLRKEILPDDQIAPFAINIDTLAMRLGYVIVRNGTPFGGVVVISS